MKRFIISLVLFISLVGSISAKTTKVGDRQYHIKNSNYQDATYEVLSEEESLMIVDVVFDMLGLPLIVENNTGIDPEVASLIKKFGYVLLRTNTYIILHSYDKSTDSINTVMWS